MGRPKLAVYFFAVIAAASATLKEEVEIIKVSIKLETDTKATYICVLNSMQTATGDNNPTPILSEKIKDTKSPLWDAILEFDFDQHKFFSLKIYKLGREGNPLKEKVYPFADFVKDISDELDNYEQGTLKISHKGMNRRVNLCRLYAEGKNIRVAEKQPTILVVSGQPEFSDGNEWEEAVRTEPRSKTKAPQWSKVAFSADLVTSNAHEDRKILLEVCVVKADGKLEKFGEVTLELSVLRAATYPAIFNLRSDDPEAKIVVKEFMIKEEKLGVVVGDTIHEYMPFCELNMLNAIDFTGSNGDPNAEDSLFSQRGIPATVGNGKNSLHYLPRDDFAQNQYSFALYAGVGILDKYDRDHLFPTCQFGGILKSGTYYNKDFLISYLKTLSGEDPKHEDGVVDVYKTATANIKPQGGTYFAQLVRDVIALAKPYKNKPVKFFTLYILTDGVISDMQQTIDEIVLASEYPIAIIIVCVGDADFANMKILDADNAALQSSTTKNFAKDDIVQSVPISKVIRKTKAAAEELGMDPAAVEKKVLDEVQRKVLKEYPGRFMRFMHEKNALGKKLMPTHIAAMAA